MLYLVHLVKREIRIDNDSSDKHWLHRYLLIQLPYDHDHDNIPVSSTDKADRHDIHCNWNIVESGAKHHNPNPTELEIQDKSDNVVSSTPCQARD
jgi:hypothetical protein